MLSSRQPLTLDQQFLLVIRDNPVRHRLTCYSSRVHACDLPDKYDLLVEEFKDSVRTTLPILYIARVIHNILLRLSAGKRNGFQERPPRLA